MYVYVCGMEWSGSGLGEGGVVSQFHLLVSQTKWWMFVCWFQSNT